MFTGSTRITHGEPDVLLFAGHLRSIIGGLTVEQIIRERDRVAQEVKDGSHAEMEKLGIVVDALDLLEIQEIEDTSGYINNLAAPHAAAVASPARIAQAKADQLAAEQEQQAAAMKAQYARDLELSRSGFLAETEEAQARAAKVQADAAAYAERATAEAEADANRSRAGSLADGNEELIAAHRIGSHCRSW